MSGFPIVVVAYNRPSALGRLLNSLDKAMYPDDVKLIISVDGGGSAEVRQIAEDFTWRFGEKELIFHEKNRGLREHVLSCGDITEQYDGIVLLEDDLFVSAGFYEYVLKAVNYYREDMKIAGISLYSHPYNETAQFPFIARNDGSDVFFFQYASSWGQCWTREQWKGFRSWYDNQQETDDDLSSYLPPNIVLWPKNSWKKHFIRYMVLEDLFFVYPRGSFTTYFSTSGTNMRIRERILQVPLEPGKELYHFRSLNDSGSVYDVYGELIPEKLKSLAPDLASYDFETDLYGMKPVRQIRDAYLISSKPCRNPILTFGKELKPHEENVIHKIDGKDLNLGMKKDFVDSHYLRKLLKVHHKEQLTYWYPIREYHFSGKRIISTKTDPQTGVDPIFLSRKGTSVFNYARKYFFGKKKVKKD